MIPRAARSNPTPSQAPGEIRAREAWAPPSRSVFEVPPGGFRLGGHVFRGRAVATLADMVLAFIPHRGRRRGERGRPRAHAERIALALRCELAARRSGQSFRAAALAELRAAGVPAGWQCEYRYNQLCKDRRWLDTRGLLPRLLSLAERIERAEAPSVGVLTAHAPRLIVGELTPGTARAGP